MYSPDQPRDYHGKFGNGPQAKEHEAAHAHITGQGAVTEGTGRWAVSYHVAHYPDTGHTHIVEHGTWPAEKLPANHGGTHVFLTPGRSRDEAVGHAARHAFRIGRVTHNPD